jgi:tetratricopeptide (TPR) repeat protein
MKRNAFLLLILLLSFQFVSAQCVSGDCVNGTGEYKLSNSTFKGKFAYGRPNGQGVQVFDNGAKYEGNFVNGVFNGEGTYYFPNKSRYTGQFLNGAPHGYGEFYFVSGARYKGQMKSGAMHGEGTYFYKSGNVYEGTFKNGDKCGKGELRYKSGDVYVGKFKNDGRHGKATHTFFDGNVYSGIWKNDDGDKVFTKMWNQKHLGKCVADDYIEQPEPGDLIKYIDSLYAVYIKKEGLSIVVANTDAYKSFADGEFEEADKGFTELIEKNPNCSSLYLYRGMSRELDERYRRAASDYHILVGKFHDETLLHLEATMLTNGDKDSAAAVLYEEILKLNPKSINALTELGSYYTHIKKNKDLAVKYLSEVVRLKPSVDSKGDLLLCYMVFKDNENTQKLIDEIMSNCKGDLFYYLKIGQMYRNAEQEQMAILYYNKILNEDNLKNKMPLNKIESAYFGRAWAYSGSGKQDSAITDYLKAISFDEKDPLYWNNLAFAYVIKGNGQKALELISKCLSLDSNYEHGYNTRAEAYSVLGNHEKFYRDMELCLKKGYDSYDYLVKNEHNLYTPYKNEKRYKDLIEKYKAIQEEEKEK